VQQVQDYVQRGVQGIRGWFPHGSHEEAQPEPEKSALT